MTRKLNLKKIVLYIFGGILAVLLVLVASYLYNKRSVDKTIIEFGSQLSPSEARKYLSSESKLDLNNEYNSLRFNKLQGSAFDSVPIVANDGSIANRYAGSNVVFMLIKEKGEWKIYNVRRLK